MAGITIEGGTLKLFFQLEQAILEPMKQTSQKIAAALSADLAPVVTAAATLYIIFQGYSLMKGQRHFGAPDLLSSCIKLTLISSLLGGYGSYQEYVALPLSTYLPEALVASIGSATGVPESGSSGTLDSLSAGVLVVSENIWAGSGWSIKSIAMAFGMWLALWASATYFLLVSFCLILFTKMSLLLVLSLGPIFVLCALFPVTRDYMSRWVGAIVTLIILQALVAVLCTTMVSTIATVFNSMKTQSFSEGLQMAGAVMQLSLMTAFAAVISRQLPTIASQIGGGLTLGTESIAKALADKSRGLIRPPSHGGAWGATQALAVGAMTAGAVLSGAARSAGISAKIGGKP